MITADQLIAHAVGDYILQSDWMATEKTKKSLAALCHVLTYVLPFLLITRDPKKLAVIMGTHFIIDRWRLARFVVWVKNFMAPRQYPLVRKDGVSIYTEPRRNHRFEDCSATGYPHDRPDWLAFWLLIVADNILHVLINGLALRYL